MACGSDAGPQEAVCRVSPVKTRGVLVDCGVTSVTTNDSESGLCPGVCSGKTQRSPTKVKSPSCRCVVLGSEWEDTRRDGRTACQSRYPAQCFS